MPNPYAPPLVSSGRRSIAQPAGPSTPIALGQVTPSPSAPAPGMPPQLQGYLGGWFGQHPDQAGQMQQWWNAQHGQQGGPITPGIDPNGGMPRQPVAPQPQPISPQPIAPQPIAPPPGLNPYANLNMMPAMPNQPPPINFYSHLMQPGY